MKSFLVVLLLLVLHAVSGPAGLAAEHGTKAARSVHAEPVVRYTKHVREVTKEIKVEKGKWTMIICHHSGLKNGNAKTYEREHRRRGMENGLAYHFLIGNGVDSGDGEIEIGSRWLKQIKGGHVRSDELNEKAIGICLVGNFEEQRPTKKQVAALRELLLYLRDEVVANKLQFSIHTEADPNHTVCPGKHFPTKAMRRLFK